MRKKYAIRIISGVLAFLFFRLTNVNHWADFFYWETIDLIFLAYTLAVFLITWEVASYSINYYKNKESFQTNKGFFRVFFKTAFSMLPFVVLFSYLYSFHLHPACCQVSVKACHEWGMFDPTSQFWVYNAQGFLISLLIISSDTIHLYIRNAVNTAREKDLIQKELIAAKFEGLKNQVNPHFLFNSFSVLASLVESNKKDAIKFLSKLSDMYRYILENDENEMVPISMELRFLADYMYLLEMRHHEGIVLKNNLQVDDRTLVPPMSLQILVENAVKHNSFSNEDPLTIQLFNEGDQFIVVENPKKPKKELVSSTGIGLKNLSKRLLLSIRKGLEITDNATEFRVKLPI